MRVPRKQRMFLVRSVMTFAALGILILTAPTPSFAFNTAVIDWAIRELCGHITGHLGALLTAVALLGAVVSAALGSFRAFFGAIIVAVGAFAVPDIVRLYFPTAAGQCDAGATAKTPRLNRSAEALEIGNGAQPPAAASKVSQTSTQQFSSRSSAEPSAAEIDSQEEDLASLSWKSLAEEF